MMTVRIPVSPLSKCILLTESEGDTPVSFGNYNPAYYSCYIQRPVRDKLKLIDLHLTDSIEIRLSNYLALRARRFGHHIGYFLHRFHIEKMMSFVLGRWVDGMEVKSSILMFYKMYGITEDDYSLDSACRKWTRFKSKHSGKFFRFHSKEGDKKRRNFSEERPWTQDEIKSAIETVLNSHPDIFIGKDKRVGISSTLMDQLYTYLMVNKGRFKSSYLSEKLGVTIRSIQYRITTFRDLIESNPDLDKTFKTL